jgi:hypothetical protein
MNIYSEWDSTNRSLLHRAVLATLAHNMEEQYLKLRTMFRRISSIHRMQAL